MSIEVYEDGSALEKFIVAVRFSEFPEEDYAISMWENPEEGTTYVHPLDDARHRFDPKFAPLSKKISLESLPKEHLKIVCGYLSDDVHAGRISGRDFEVIPSGVLAGILSDVSGTADARERENFESYPPPA